MDYKYVDLNRTGTNKSFISKWLRPQSDYRAELLMVFRNKLINAVYKYDMCYSKVALDEKMTIFVVVEIFSNTLVDF